MTQAGVLTEDYLPTLIRLLYVLRIQDTDNAVIRQYSSVLLSLAAWQTPLTTLILEEASRDDEYDESKKGPHFTCSCSGTSRTDGLSNFLVARALRKAHRSSLPRSLQCI